MVSGKNILALTFSVAGITAEVLRRDVQALASSIDDVDSKARAFTTVVQNYPGGFFQSLDISTADTNLINALNTATSTAAQIQGPINQEDFGTLAPRLQSLPSDVMSGLAAMKAKRDALKNAGVASLVVTALGNTKAAHDSFSDAVIAILPVEAQNQGRQGKANEDAEFDDAIASFQE